MGNHKSVVEYLTIKNTVISMHLKLHPVKIYLDKLHCSILAEDSINVAVKDYLQKNK